jgi:hypothetical protein
MLDCHTREGAQETAQAIEPEQYSILAQKGQPGPTNMQRVVRPAGPCRRSSPARIYQWTVPPTITRRNPSHYRSSQRVESPSESDPRPLSRSWHVGRPADCTSETRSVTTRRPALPCFDRPGRATGKWAYRPATLARQFVTARRAAVRALNSVLSCPAKSLESETPWPAALGARPIQLP